jgi:uncharacterized membrane protein
MEAGSGVEGPCRFRRDRLMLRPNSRATMGWPVHGWSPLLIGHVLGAALAMILGAVNLLRPIRGDPTHKIIGYTWTVLMYWVALSSFWIREINDGRFSWIHLLSLVTIVTLSLGVRAAIQRRFRTHRGMMRGTYFGLLGAFIGAVVVPDRLVPQLAVNEPRMLLLGVAVVALSALLIVASAFRVGRRASRPAPQPREPS